MIISDSLGGKLDTTAQENRLRKFASFFKSYMGVMPLVTAAVAPLLTVFRVMPVIESDRTTLATFSGLLGFLMVAWIFYARSTIVRMMMPGAAFPVSKSRDELGVSVGTYEAHRLGVYKPRRLRRIMGDLLPLGLIAMSVFCYGYYLEFLNDAISMHSSNGDVTMNEMLRRLGTSYPILNHGGLQASYLGIFLFSEAAFVVMALREYAYGVLRISEASVLRQEEGLGLVTAIGAPCIPEGLEPKIEEVGESTTK